MKNHLHRFIICSTILFISILSIFAQTEPMSAPDGLLYQAEARDLSGKLLTNKELNVKLIITEESYSGMTVWEGIYTVYTDKYGLFSLIIGEGESNGYIFSDIDWNLHQHFLNVQLLIDDIWSTSGSLQFLSVPYAFYASDAGNAENANYATQAGSYDEMDPVYTLSPSATITEGDKNNWNRAFNWGDHSEVGYLTKEVDGSVTNELQYLSLAGDILKISKNPEPSDINLSKYNPLTETEVEEYVANSIPSGYMPYRSHFGSYFSSSVIFQGSDNKIGIGRSDPYFNLDVNGNIRATEDVIANDKVYADQFTYNTSKTKILMIPGFEGNYEEPFRLGTYQERTINWARMTTPKEANTLYYNVDLPVGAHIVGIRLYLTIETGTTTWKLIRSNGWSSTNIVEGLSNQIGTNWTSRLFPDHYVSSDHYYCIKINHDLFGNNYIRAIEIEYTLKQL